MTVKFQPRIGSDYAAAKFGKRVLVVGDSHYEWQGSGNIDQWADITRTLVQEQIDGEYTKRFWTNIAIMFLNRRPTLADKHEFWHSVSFFNYLQSSAGFGPDSVPLEDQWQNSHSAFFEVLANLKPQLIVVLGDRVWNRLPPVHRTDGEPIPGADWMKTYRYAFPGGSALSIQVRHPGRAFNGRDWHPHLSNALALASSEALGDSAPIDYETH